MVELRWSDILKSVNKLTINVKSYVSAFQVEIWGKVLKVLLTVFLLDILVFYVCVCEVV